LVVSYVSPPLGLTRGTDELVKNLVLVGFANIEIVSLFPLVLEERANIQIDLDTIDLSNLNRQFLFRKPDISKSKALVAAVTARHFNPSSGINIHARHGNVKEGTNDVEWIKGFGLVMNALDNAGAFSCV
jgi:ubiquitin-like 1-activating enzyme E1 B